MTTELYLVRHGQSTNNILPDERNRVRDAPLTEIGKSQAVGAAQELWKLRQIAPANHRDWEGAAIPRLYCSPMFRALETTQPIAAALGVRAQVWVDLHEQGGVYLDDGTGKLVGYPGKSRAEILADFPDYILPDSITEEGWWKGGYEDYASCFARAQRVSHQLLAIVREEGWIILVSHNTFLDALLKTLLGQSNSREREYAHNNGGVSKIVFEKNGHMTIHFLNRATKELNDGRNDSA